MNAGLASKVSVSYQARNGGGRALAEIGRGGPGEGWDRKIGKVL